ncbi:MAG: dihydrodipicolinate synthase family protein [Anaerolineae bacterium]|nr:dihydrodipicolinate synthase family protein [Anaerolineae bacterium]
MNPSTNELLQARSARSSLDLSGVFPPIPTPFDRAGEVALDALAENIQRWNEYALSGYVILGSNGEAAYLTEKEKLRVLEAARQVIPSHKLMIAGTGCESLRSSVTFTRQAADIGADVALVITPHFYDGQMTCDSLVQFYAAVADASTIPVVLYNVPKFTHVDMPATTIAKAASHANIVGIKDSGGNITKLGDTIRLTPPDFQVLAGSASFLFASLALGAAGGVVALANVAPQQAIDIVSYFKARQWDEAADLQRKMIPVNTAITARFGVAGLKAALDMLGYYGGPVRAPLLDLDESERQALKQVLVDGGVLRAQ